MIIREAKREDISALAEISLSECENPWSYEQLLEEWTFNFSKIIISEQNDEITGFVAVHTTEDGIHINEIAIKRAFNRNGIASALIEKTILYSPKRITLEVRESNRAAISLYEKYDFKIVGKRIDFYNKPRETALVMALELEDI